MPCESDLNAKYWYMYVFLCIYLQGVPLLWGCISSFSVTIMHIFLEYGLLSELVLVLLAGSTVNGLQCPVSLSLFTNKCILLAEVHFIILDICLSFLHSMDTFCCGKENVEQELTASGCAAIVFASQR